MSERLEIRPNPGPQEKFLRSPAREAFFGGAAGPGKSFALLLDACRYIDRRHYRALLLRRTYPELEQSLLEGSHKIYPNLGGRYVGDKRLWVFESGAKIRFGYLEHENDKFRYDGAEFQYVGFDELTGFTRGQYLFLFSRLRSPDGIPTYMRATSNPGGPGHEWVLERFAPWIYPPDNTEYSGPRARPGQLLYYRSAAQGEVVCDANWYDPNCRKCSCGKPCNRHRPRSRTYIPGLLADNPHLVGTDYAANLEELDPVTKAHKRDGDWLARPTAGAFFKRAMFGAFVDAAPTQVLARVRYWDRASTEGDGDWTVGVLMSVTADGTFWVEHVIREQLGPADVVKTIKATAELDGGAVPVALERDPAQAGKFEAHYYITELVGYDVKALPPFGDKLTRAKPVSAQASVGNIRLVRGAWNAAYIREVEGFPEGTKDQVDATSGAFQVLLPRLVAHRRAVQARLGGGGGVTVRTTANIARPQGTS